MRGAVPEVWIAKGDVPCPLRHLGANIGQYDLGRYGEETPRVDGGNGPHPPGNLLAQAQGRMHWDGDGHKMSVANGLVGQRFHSSIDGQRSIARLPQHTE